MALTEPLDLLSNFPGWCTSFDLMARQEQSRHASGRTRVKDFGQPIWRASYVSRSLSPNELDHWRARLSHAMVSQMTFLAWPSSRCWPIKHPRGELVDLSGWVLESGFWDDDGVWRTDVPWGENELPEGAILSAIGPNNDTIRLAGAQGVSISIGDVIQIGVGLYRAVEDAVANINGITPLFTVEPHLWPGTTTGTEIALHRPSCPMTIDPGSVNASADSRTGRGTVSFTATEAR